MGRAVLITVRGTVKARLTKVEASPAGFDGRAWVGELRTLQEAAAAEMLCALYRKECAGDLKNGGALATYRKFLGDCRAGRIVLVPYGEVEAGAVTRPTHPQFARVRDPEMEYSSVFAGTLGRQRAS